MTIYYLNYITFAFNREKNVSQFHSIHYQDTLNFRNRGTLEKNIVMRIQII